MTVLPQPQDPIALAHAIGAERAREAGDAVVEGRPCVSMSSTDDGRALGMRLAVLGEDRRQGQVVQRVHRCHR